MAVTILISLDSVCQGKTTDMSIGCIEESLPPKLRGGAGTLSVTFSRTVLPRITLAKWALRATSPKLDSSLIVRRFICKLNGLSFFHVLFTSSLVLLGTPSILLYTCSPNLSSFSTARSYFSVVDFGARPLLFLN